MKQDQQARAQLKDLAPSTEFLFGGKVGALCKDLKDSAELNPLASHGSFPKRGRGSYGHVGCGYNPRGGFNQYWMPRPEYKPARGRGAPGAGRGNRLSKFKDN